MQANVGSMEFFCLSNSPYILHALSLLVFHVISFQFNNHNLLYPTSQDAATQPSLVIVYFGGNDSMGPHPSGLGPHVPLHEYITNMRKILIHIQVLLLSVYHLVLSPSVPFTKHCRV